MTYKELWRKTTVRRANGYGCYAVTIEYRGKEYRCVSDNTSAWDRLHDDCTPDNVKYLGFTRRSALQSFYDECKQKNGLSN